MEPRDFGEVRRMLVALAMKMKGDIGFFYSIPFLEAVGIMKEVTRIGKGK